MSIFYYVMVLFMLITMLFLAIKYATATNPMEKEETSIQIRSLLPAFILVGGIPYILPLLTNLIYTLVGEEMPNIEDNIGILEFLSKANTPTLIFVLFMVFLVAAFIAVSYKSISRNDDKSPVEFETYDVENNLSYDEKLRIFKTSLLFSVKNQWEEIENNIKFLKNKNFYNELFNETGKMLNDLAVKSVINGKVSDDSKEEFKNTLKEYDVYVKKQIEEYYLYEKRQLQEAQPFINSEYEKVRDTIKLMKDDPLDYK